MRLSDFGLSAKLTGTHGYLPPVGSPDYLPPERRTAELSDRGMKVRLNEDVWAFGVIVHRVLTGRFPFPGSTARARADAAARYVTGERPLVVGRDLPNNWHKVVSACLAAEPGARPDASQLLTAVRSAVGESTSAGRMSSRRGLAVATAVVGLATVLLGSYRAYDPG